MTVNFKTRLGHRLASNNREANSTMSSVRTQRLTATTIGLATAVCMTLGASASPALAATSTTGTVATTPTTPSAVLSTGSPQQTPQGRNIAYDYTCNQIYYGNYYGSNGQLYQGNYYYPCNYVLPKYIPDPPSSTY